jgi:phage terminase large subunit
MKAQYTGQFYEQEIMGNFTSFEGLVYSGFQRHLHEVSAMDLPPFSKVIAGMDFGSTNPTAIVVCGLDYDNRLWVMDEFYKRKATLDEIVAKCQALKDKYKIGQFYGDPSGAMFIRHLNEHGVPVMPANNEVTVGIGNVSSRLALAHDGKPRLMVSTACPYTLTEFEQYQYEEEKDGKPVTDKPKKVNDHAMDALRYACMSMGNDYVTAQGGFGDDDSF